MYADFIRLLGWHVASIDGSNIFCKHFPLLGGMAKMHRPTKLPDIKKLSAVLQKYKIRSISIEPDSTMDQKKFTSWIKKLKKYITINRTKYLPTKTIHIDLTGSEDSMFQGFSEAKRRAVRRAQKNNLQINESANIDDLIEIKNKSAGLFGFVTTTGVKELWKVFGPDHASILMASNNTNAVIAGILLLFWQKTSYYWIAGASREGKKLFAPTILVWEALKIAKKRGCKQFDFVGVWDERKPEKFHDWKGFTKFKEGFGGSSIYYPL